MIRIPISCDCDSPDLLPRYHSEGSSGADLHADLPKGRPVTVPPGRQVCIPTGLRLEMPPGYEAQVRPRSGLGAKHGVTVLNAPGTIDSDYRGEIQVILINLGHAPFVVERGMRIAQIVFAPVVQAKFQPKKTLNRSERGAGGFGSTGS